MLADKPFGQWNSFRIVMVGSRVSIWLNGKSVVQHAVMENYYDRKKPIPARGPIQLQTHGGEIRWKNVFIREIGGTEANQILASHGQGGFQSIWNGKDLTGWSGAVNDYEVVDGSIRCKKGKEAACSLRPNTPISPSAPRFRCPALGTMASRSAIRVLAMPRMSP